MLNYQEINSLNKINKINSWYTQNYNFQNSLNIKDMINYKQLTYLLKQHFKYNFISNPIVKLTSNSVNIRIYYLYPQMYDELNNNNQNNNNNIKYLISYMNSLIELYTIDNKDTSLKNFIKDIYGVSDIKIELIKLNSLMLDASILREYLSIKYRTGKNSLRSSRLLFKLLSTTEANNLNNYKFYLYRIYKNRTLENIRFSNISLLLANQFITGVKFQVTGRLSAKKAAEKSKNVKFSFNSFNPKSQYKGTLKGVTILNGNRSANVQIDSKQSINLNGAYNVRVHLGMNN